MVDTTDQPRYPKPGRYRMTFDVAVHQHGYLLPHDSAGMISPEWWVDRGATFEPVDTAVDQTDTVRQVAADLAAGMAAIAEAVGLHRETDEVEVIVERVRHLTTERTSALQNQQHAEQAESLTRLSLTMAENESRRRGELIEEYRALVDLLAAPLAKMGFEDDQNPHLTRFVQDWKPNALRPPVLPREDYFWLGDLAGFEVVVGDACDVALRHRCGWAVGSSPYLGNLVVACQQHTDCAAPGTS